MTISPEHLFEQAEKLASTTEVGAPRQTDLRRALSSTYYGLFHFVMMSLADEFVGATQRKNSRYMLFYRHTDHRTLKTLCEEVGKKTLSSKYVPYITQGGLGPEIQDFANIVIELQEKRHSADYDPTLRFRKLDVELTVKKARTAIERFGQAKAENRKDFLTLLLCRPR